MHAMKVKKKTTGKKSLIFGTGCNEGDELSASNFGRRRGWKEIQQTAESHGEAMSCKRSGGASNSSAVVEGEKEPNLCLRFVLLLRG
jgi:hypothetical protein